MRSNPFILAGAFLAALCGSPLMAQQQFQVVKLNLISTARATRTSFDYTYRVDVLNTGAAATGLAATVTSTSPNTTIVEGELAFGDIAAGETISSSDTFKLRQNRLVPFNPAALSFHFVTNPMPNMQPIADAGDDQTARAGDTVQLDGSGSRDPDGSIVCYSWTLAGSIPVGLPVSIPDPCAAKQTVLISSAGTYTFRLVVTDDKGDSSTPDEVKISTGPVANAGTDQKVDVGATVQLDGSGSSDPEGLSLNYSWTLVSKPTGSTAQLSNPKIPNPTFVADVAGTYNVELVVNNGVVSSEPDAVDIKAGIIKCGEVISGSLRVPGGHDTYKFLAVAGDVALVSVAGDANGGALAELYDPSGALLMTSAPNGTTGTVALPVTGTYTILVLSYYSTTAAQNYGLSLQFTKGQCEAAGGISCGQSLTGKLTTMAEYRSYRFTASSGDAVLVSVAGDANGGALAELYDPSGALLKTSAPNGTTGTVALQANGTYTILVLSYFSTVAAQDYGLSLQFTKGQCGTGISCGQSLTGKLSNMAEYQPYRFTASSGDAVLVSVAGDANGGALAELYDPSGALLKTSAPNGTTGTVALSANGTYTILVLSYYSTTAAQNFGVSLSCLSGP